MIRVSAPGKLFIAGEWAILEGHKGVVAAVDKRVYAEAAESENISLTLDDFGIKDLEAEFDGKLKIKCLDPEKEKYMAFTKAALEAALSFLGKYKNFKLRAWGDKTSIIVNGVRKKVGFGSSAASTVAVIGAVLKLHGYNLEENKELICKLAAISHYLAQGKVGSGYDVAASVYGGIFVYRKFDSKWLISQLKTKPVRDTIKAKWPGFFVENLGKLENFHMDVCWTRESASTVDMIRQMEKFKKENPTEYNRIYKEIGNIVEQLIGFWKSGNKAKILDALRKNQQLLLELTKMSGVNIVTEDFRKLAGIASENNCVGKVSGAGGGDCGIVISFEGKDSEAAKKKLEKDFQIIKTKIDFQGIG